MKPKIKQLILPIITLCLINYIVWWNNKGVYSGHHPLSILPDVPLALIIPDLIYLVILLNLIAILIIALFKIRKHITFKILIVVISLFLLINFGAFRSEIVMKLYNCHESACSDLTLRENGTFDLNWSINTASYKFHGKYYVKNNKVNLYLNNNEPNKEEYLKLNKMKNHLMVYCYNIDFNCHIGPLRVLD